MPERKKAFKAVSNNVSVAHVDGAAVVLLRDLQGWCRHNLLPSQAHVSAEDDDSRQVEEHPAQRLEDLEPGWFEESFRS